MDNLSHSLSGALAAKLAQPKAPAAADSDKLKRTLFWLFVISANLPDLDVVMGLFGDPLHSIKHHRGLTHSLLFAPVFALLPAWVAFRFRRLASLQVFWLVSLIGILVHIFFDLITSFGTQLLAPFSEKRFALDWMFIIDPFFTGTLGLALLLGKFIPKRKDLIITFSAVFVAGYLFTEMICHHLAYRRTESNLAQTGISATKISALPQPLSIFRWKGLAQTETGVMQTFFSVFDEGPLQFTPFENAGDPFVARALATEEARWYMKFARHPWIRSRPNGQEHLVELSDLQFSIDTRLIQALGFPERSMPFVMQFVYSPAGELATIFFERRELRQNSEADSGGFSN